MNGVGQAGDVGITLLDNGESEDRQIHADDAATDRLSLALTSAAGAVARVAVSEEEADTVGSKDTLLHGETLLVVSTSDAEDVALELVADRVTGNLSAHALLHEDGELARIVNLEELLAAVGRVGNVQLDMSVSTVVDRGCGDAFDNEYFVPSKMDSDDHSSPFPHCE